MALRDFPCRDTAIDLGSRTARIHVRGRGVVTQVQSLIATSATTGDLVAVGSQAHAMRYYGVPGLAFDRPFEGGVPVEPSPAARLTRSLLRGAHGRRYLAKPRLAIVVPSLINEVQTRAAEELGYSAGARQLRLVPSPIAAALGSGLRIDGARAVMVADVGAARTDVAVLAFGGIVGAHLARVGGSCFDRAIELGVRNELGMLISAEIAESAKIKIGGVRLRGRQAEEQMLIHGRDLGSGLPRSAVLGAADIVRMAAGPLAEIVEAIRATLIQCPPELAHDLLVGGLTLTGGGARIRGLAAALQDETGLTVRVADHPGETLVVGAARYLEETPAFAPLRRGRNRHDHYHGALSAAG